MNLKNLLCMLFVLGGSSTLFSQSQADSLSPRKPIDINILFNYYEQDGIHSAVTGGLGTEELKDRAAKLVVHIPVDTATSIDIQGSINQYTSASTDNIDSYVSSASIKDAHATLTFGYSKFILPNRLSWNAFVGGGIESDYISSSFGGGITLSSKDQNQELSLGVQVFLDTWIVIFPEELRVPGMVSLPTDKRRSYNFSATFSQVINRKLQASLTSDLVYQTGLLSTPFHRVYFQDEELPDIERLPSNRYKFPVGLRLNYFPLDFLVVRGYYRFYYDTYDILAHTFGLEIPLKPGPFTSFYPFGRYHYQRAAKYFAPYGIHLREQEFYTSDYDLSGFQSLKVGMGIRYAPLYGLLRFKRGPGKVGMLKSVDIRGSYYWRSDGLRAWSVGMDLGWGG